MIGAGGFGPTTCRNDKIDPRASIGRLIRPPQFPAHIMLASENTM